MPKSHHTKSPGIVFRYPRAYDGLLRLLWGKRENDYRTRLLDLARVARGQSILDVGCGTGTLAIAAAERIGGEGKVVGVDPSPEMLARARTKANSRGLSIEFCEGAAQALPFGDGQFDTLLCSTVLHCIPVEARRQTFSEMGRVLKPGGLILLVDFGGAPAAKHSLIGHLSVHRSFDLSGERDRLEEARLTEIEAGSAGFSDLYYMLATMSGSKRGPDGGART